MLFFSCHSSSSSSFILAPPFFFPISWNFLFASSYSSLLFSSCFFCDDLLLIAETHLYFCGCLGSQLSPWRRRAATAEQQKESWPEVKSEVGGSEASYQLEVVGDVTVFFWGCPGVLPFTIADVCQIQKCCGWAVSFWPFAFLLILVVDVVSYLHVLVCARCGFVDAWLLACLFGILLATCLLVTVYFFC